MVGSLSRPRRGGVNRPGLCLFDVGSVVAVRAGEDRVLSSVGEDHELVRFGAADVASVGLDLGVAEPATLKDPTVGCFHRPVGGIEVLCICVEGVGVLHDELAPPHEPEARPDFVPEFCLNLVEIDRELSI